MDLITRYANLAGTMTVATTEYTYDIDGRVVNMLSKDGSTATIANFTFTYDAQHRVETQIADGVTTTYTYDNTDQITADGATTVTYDATGNRATIGNAGRTFTYDTVADNRLESDGLWDYTYSDDGNLTKKVHISTGVAWGYGYDHSVTLRFITSQCLGC